MLNLKKDSDKAKQAYEAAHEQLTIDQQDFHDYYESEKESLEQQLRPGGLEAVDATRSTRRGQRTRTARTRKTTATKNLAERARTTAAAAEQDRKAKADDR